MYQVIGIANWSSKEMGDEAHRTLIPRALDRWEEMAPQGAQALVTRCSETETTFTALFPSSEGVVGDTQRDKFRRIVGAVAKDFTGGAKLTILEGEVVDGRTRE